MGASHPMLLTLPRPATLEYEYKHAHDFIPPPPSPVQRHSFKADRDVLPPLQTSVSENMSTPHRGLPPPSAMSLPDPGRIPPPLLTAFSGMPEPPRQWQGAEESMRSWLMTKAEEEKRKQEEEKTRQESFKLEQRRIEQNMLLDAIRNGIPPQLVPLIFAGIGSSSVANLSIEWLQQYNNSLHAAQQQQMSSQTHPGSPNVQRDRQGVPYAPSAQGPAGVPPPQGQPGTQYGYGPMSPSSASRQPSGPPSASGLRASLQTVLPRLSTNEGQPPPPPSGGGAVQAAPIHGAQQDQSASSPSIYFHHWVPPASQAAAGVNPPATPSEYINSPKKRKGPPMHPANLLPTSEPRYNSASFVHVSSPAGSTPGGRKRRLSDTSTSNRGGYTSAGKKNRSRGNTESSVAISEEDRLRYRQYPVGGAANALEDRSETVSHNSAYANGPPAPKRSRRSYDHVEELSLKREPGATTVSSRKSSFGAPG